MRKIVSLALDRVKDLGSEALLIFCELSKWRENPFDDVTKNQMQMNLQACLENQFKWISAIEELEEEE